MASERTWVATQLTGQHPRWRFVPDSYMSEYDQDFLVTGSWFEFWAHLGQWSPSLAPSHLPVFGVVEEPDD